MPAETPPITIGRYERPSRRRRSRAGRDAADRIRSRFEPAEQRWLRVAVNPLTNNLSLTWMD